MTHPPPARGVGLTAAILAAVLAACAGYANLAYGVKDRAEYRYFPPFQTGYNGNDNGHLGAEYFNIAKALVAGRGFADPFPAQTGPTAWMPPILPAVEAALLWCAGGDKDVVIAAVVFLQTFTLAATGLLVLALTRATTRLGAWPAAAIFLFGVLWNFHLWFQFTHDCWIVLLALDLLIVGLVWFEPLDSNRAAAGWGMAGGLFALVSPIVGLTWGVLTVVSALRGKHTGHLRSRLAVAIVAAGLTLMPWTIRNYAVFGRLIPVKSNLAYELYQSQCLQRDGLLRNSTFKSHPIANLAARREYKALGEIAYLDHKGDEFRQAVRADPLDFLDRMASRLLGGTIWYVPIESDEEIKRPWVFWISRIAHPLPFVGLLILIFAATRGSLASTQWIVMSAYVVYLVPYIAVSYYERYAAPLLGVKVLLVLWGVDRVISGAYKNRPRLVQRATAVPAARPANGQGNNHAWSTSRNRPDGIPAMTRRTYLVLGLAVLGIAGSVFVFRPTRNAESTAGVDLVQDFHGSKQPTDPWQLSGRGAAELVQPEEAGLRVTIPAGHTPNDPIGVVIGPIVRGDCDISCGYEIIQIEKPTTGWGVGLELFVQTATPTQEAFALERMLQVNGADIYYCSRNTSLSGKREYHVKQFPAAGTTGRLRLTRAGRELTAWAADEKGDYQELGRYDLGPEDLKLVRLAAHPGVAKNAVDVRIADVKVHYDPATVNVAASAPKPSRWGWLSRAEIIGMSVTLALVVVGAVVRRIWKGRPGQIETAEPATTLRTPPINPRFARAFALVFAVGLGLMGVAYTAARPRPGPLEDVFFHDFRNAAAAPATLPFYGKRDAEFIKAEPEGMRITLPDSYIHPWGGVGYQCPIVVQGDFEVTAAIELLNADQPPTGLGVGAALRIEKASTPGGAATLCRVRRPDGNPALFWDQTVNLPDGQPPRIDSGTEPAQETVGRLRLRRIGPTLYYLWGRGIDGEDFQEINHLDFGTEDVTRFRITALTGRQPCAVDVRLLDVRIRSGPATAAALKPRRWMPAAALLLGAGLIVSGSWWLGSPTTAARRPESNPAAIPAKKWRWPMLALGLLVAVPAGAWFLRSHDPAPRRSLLNVRIGNDSVSDVAEEGFSYPEVDRLKQTFRWTDGKAKLVIPLDKAHPPRAVFVHLASYRPAGVKTARLNIVANGRSLFDDNIPLGMWKSTLDLNGLDLGEQLTLELLSDSFVPIGNQRGDGKGASDDSRTLGVQVHGITLLGPAPEEAKP